MKSKSLIASMLLPLLAVTGCANQLVPVTKPTDADLSCKQMSAERQSLLNEMQAMAGGNDKNIPAAAARAGGLMFLPADFLRSLGRSNAREMLNRQARYNQLVNVSLAKDCKLSSLKGE